MRRTRQIRTVASKRQAKRALSKERQAAQPPPRHDYALSPQLLDLYGLHVGKVVQEKHKSTYYIVVGAYATKDDVIAVCRQLKPSGTPGKALRSRHTTNINCKGLSAITAPSQFT